MTDFFGSKSEKKVEYIELIYDLIFVYLIGRNNSLLHNIESGFFSINTFFTYFVSTVVILQIWYFSTLFINRYGKKSASEYICLFINMYLLYYLADGTRADWGQYYIRYNVAWGIILINIAFQYWRVLRNSKRGAMWAEKHLKYHMTFLIMEAVIVFAAIPVYALTGLPLSWLSLVFGFIAAIFYARVDVLVPVNTEHLTERIMLFVVFTFGEMIVGLSAYFTGGFSWNTVYFSLMAFLIVVGLFLSYGYFYDNILDRERDNMESGYMILHIVLIFAMNNITVALEFMREPEVGLIAKNIFIVASFLLYYLFLMLIGHYAREDRKANGKSIARLVCITVLFVGLMAVCYRNSWLSIAASVLYVYSMLGAVVLQSR